jgi:uncharacterized protein (DUF433 family)
MEKRYTVHVDDNVARPRACSTPMLRQAKVTLQGATMPHRKRQKVQSGLTMPEPVIVIDREVMSGTPCFRGTRVPFKNLIDYLEGGHSLGEFLQQFPSVTHEMAVQALEEAKDSLLARIG